MTGHASTVPALDFDHADAPQPPFRISSDRVATSGRPAPAGCTKERRRPRLRRQVSTHLRKHRQHLCIRQSLHELPKSIPRSTHDLGVSRVPGARRVPGEHCPGPDGPSA